MLFDQTTGNLLGTLQDPSGNPIVNIGLWALMFGANSSGNYSTRLFHRFRHRLSCGCPSFRSGIFIQADFSSS
jgi:hypothetical protein